MPVTTLNLGILAHIDAGKTSLTERLLFDNGAVSELGSVDAGSTRTDTGELERERGITIRSAVAAFTSGDLQVNLVDTPGHPDFIAEVERALSVLDGAVLVVSAVEGVQAQTRVLMRSLRAMRLPTVIFVNKIDRMGARHDDLLADIRAKLAPHVVPMGTVTALGTSRARAVAHDQGHPGVRARMAEVLAEYDDGLLERLVDGVLPAAGELRELLVRQTAEGDVHPVFFGSALSGEGTKDLTAGVAALLRPPPAERDAPARGTVFAVERSGSGDKIAYLRLFSGQVRERETVTFHRPSPGGTAGAFRGRITRLDVVSAPRPDNDAPSATDHGQGRRMVTAGSIARLRGLPHVRVGDRVGTATGGADGPRFSPPSLETVVRPAQPGLEARLHAALTRLADEDPLIRTRSAGGGATSVLLYGAVQREVIGDRLQRDFGIDAVFEPVTPVYFERPAGAGEAVTEMDRHGRHDFWATIGLRVAPAPVGSGVVFTREVEWGALPRAFHRAIEDTVVTSLEQGLYGWEVADCAVTLVRVGYASPLSTAADFRGLTPLVLMRALRAAGTRVFEPCQSVEVEIPADALTAVTSLLTGLGAEVDRTTQRGPVWTVTARVPARAVQDLTTALPGLTHGEGVVWSSPGADRPVRGTIPRRERVDGNPLNREEYLRYLSDRSLHR